MIRNAWNKGIPMSKELRIKYKRYWKSLKTKKQKKESNIKRSETMKKRWKYPTWDNELRSKRLSDKLKGREGIIFNTGRTHFKKGEHISLKTEFKKGEHRGIKSEFKKGKEHPNWQGGKSFDIYPEEFNKELKLIIRTRDGFTCQECNFTEEQLGHKLNVHHIDYDKKNNDSDNLISLCRSCHIQTNFDRNDWSNYFQNKIGGIKS